MAKIEIIRREKRSKLSYIKSLKEKHWIGIILIISALLIWLPLPIPDRTSIAALIVVAIGIYQFIKG